MQFKRRLRSRIIISFLLFGILLSGLFALTALGMRQYLENQLIDETLVGDLEDWLDSLIAGSANPDGISSTYYAWVGTPENAMGQMPNAMPEDRELRNRVIELVAKPSGLYSFVTTSGVYRVAVDKRSGIWGYVFFDSTPNPREKLLLYGFLATALVVFSMLALILARWSSKRVMAPVSDLALRISDMGRGDVHPAPLTPNYAQDEVGQLATALDDYANRLTKLVVRDKEFNADVSHELRTPLAVIRSATELLMAQPDLNDKTRTRLQRIERATKQSTELTEALLHLVRSERIERNTGEFLRIDKIVEEVVDFKRSLLERKPVDVQVHVKNTFLVRAPDAVIAVSLGNLIGNAFKYTPQGSVNITVGDQQVVVEDTGPGLEENELQEVFTRHYRGSTASGKGSGLGLSIVKRFCEIYDWKVEINPREQGGLRAILLFGSNT